MVNYEEARVKLTSTQLHKLKSKAKNKTGVTLRVTKKNFENEELPQLFLTTRQTTKIRHAFANSMLTDIKLSKAQISKIIQSGGFLGSWLAKLGKKVMREFAIPFAKNNLPGLVSNIASNAASNVINKFGGRISGKRAVRAGKRFTWLISNEDTDDSIKTVNYLEDSEVLIDGVLLKQ